MQGCTCSDDLTDPFYFDGDGGSDYGPGEGVDPGVDGEYEGASDADANGAGPDYYDLAGNAEDDDQDSKSDPDVDIDILVEQIFGPDILQRSFIQEVQNLQIYLNAYLVTFASDGIDYLDENGVFDTQTERVLLRFQIEHGIEQEIGCAGYQTKTKLVELYGNLVF